MGTVNITSQTAIAVPRSTRISTYNYKPLQTDYSIRILDLEPAAAKDAPLRASLREVALSDEPDYEAMSYAWGPADLTTSLELPEGILYITDSLASGLRRFRGAEKLRALWVDAVSIDQHSDSEKSRQVAQMGSVYRNSTRCLIWLGHPSGSEAAAERFMAAYATLVASRQRYGIEVTPQGDVVGGWTAGIPETGPVRDALQKVPVEFDWNGADEFYDSAWFNRRWCLQELVLSPKAEVYYGAHHISWNDFMIAAHIAWRSVIKTKPANLRLPRNFLQARALAEARILFRGGARLAVFLHNFPTFACSDDRDYIYSMISLRTAQDIEIWPDYTKTTAQVFKQTIRKMYLKDTKESITLLHHAGLAHRLSPPRGRGLKNTIHQNIPPLDEVFKEVPSWAPDWRVNNPFFPIKKGVGPKFFEASSQFHTYVKSDDEGTFSILAYVVGTITSRKDLGAETDMYYNEHRDRLVEWKAWFDDQCSRTPPIPKNEDPLLIFLRTIIADQNSVTTPNTLRKVLSSEELISLWNRIISTTYYDQGPDAQYETDGSALGTANSPTGVISQFSDLFAFRRALRQLLDDRQIFATSQGFIGLGPSVAREGDIVVFFSGLPSLFLIRASADTSRFYLIGDCYIHGLMYGELKTTLKESNDWAWCHLI